jgi:hypothetical protein
MGRREINGWREIPMKEGSRTEMKMDGGSIAKLEYGGIGTDRMNDMLV